MINVSVEKAVKDIRKEFVDLTNQEFNKGVSRAINHTLAKGKTASSKEIRQVYDILARDLTKSITIRRSNPNELFGYVIAQGKPIPLKNFKPRQTSEGVTVAIKKGNRTLIKGAFIAVMKSGHSGIFARGTQRSGAFNFRHKRIRPSGGSKTVNGRSQPVNNDLGINELKSISAPIAFSNKIVIKNLSNMLEQQFPDRLVHELGRMR